MRDRATLPTGLNPFIATSFLSPSNCCWQTRRKINPSSDIVLLIILSSLLIIGTVGLKDVKLEGPNYVRRGESLTLTCNYDTESETLYAVKWYRGSEEFYRYIPKEVPPQQVFPVNGIDVDLNQSDDHSVILKNTSTSMDGMFRCSVSSEGTFQTKQDFKDVSTVVVGYDAPSLAAEKLTYLPGEVGRAKCSIERTYPTANITWFINDQQALADHFLTRVSEDELDPGLTSTFSTLIFNVSKNYSPLFIKCKGHIFDLYSESSVITIQPKADVYLNLPQPTHPSNRNNSSSHSKSTLTKSHNSGGAQGGESLGFFPRLVPYVFAQLLVISLLHHHDQWF